MNHYYLEVAIEVGPEQIDPLCALLMEIGSTGITVEERALDTFVPPDPHADKTSGGTIKAYFDADRDLYALLAEIRPLCFSVGAVPPVAVEKIPSRDWAQDWKQHFPPLYVGGTLLILPSWEEMPPAPPDHVLRLDPGMAFGTGTHETTALCLEQLAYILASQPVDSVLDVGTGSGILAMAAAALGVPMVLGCDIDPEACDVARENCRVNRLDQIEITNKPLNSLERGYDVVVANILAEENVRLAGELCQRLNPGGRLILSGILGEKETFVQQGFQAMPLDGPEMTRRGDWSCLVYRKQDA